MKVQIISELEINEFKRIILPLLIQVSETKFTITCEEEMTKKTTNLTLTTPMPDDNLSNYPFVGEEGLFIKRQYISTEEEILDCSRKKSVKSRVLDTEILNKKEDNLGLLKKKRNRPNSMEKEIISIYKYQILTLSLYSNTQILIKLLFYIYFILNLLLLIFI